MTTPVRDARPDDLPRLRAVQAVVLAEPWPALLSAAVDGPPVCLVYADPDPTGYALAVVDDDAGYLAELAVARGYRGDGQGSALLSTLVGRLRQERVTRLRVTVREVDDRARSFYRGHRFRERDRLPDHYEDCDGLLLVRELDTP
jgi:ribosomal-protein-alanine N-acetyltransferase